MFEIDVVCSGKSGKRTDDTPETIQRRISGFHDATLPVLKHFQKASGKAAFVVRAPIVTVRFSFVDSGFWRWLSRAGV